MARDDVFRALQAADERIERLRPRIRPAPTAPLPAGEWRVRDALSHIAARGNALPVAQSFLERTEQAAAGGAPQPPFDIHEINAGQVRDRSERSTDELLDELLAGHRATRDGLAALDDALLDRRFTVPFPPGDVTFADFLILAGPRHEGSHLDEVEAALKSG
jgi:hypothetical protein